MEKEIISIDYGENKIIADVIPFGAKPQVFCIHGAGVSNRKLFDPLRHMLLENDISSCALDLLGHGDTGGSIKNSSLKSRVEQAKLVIEKAQVTKPITLIAASMGGYDAIKLTQIFPVSLLVLFAPAVYTPEAYEVLFDDKFSSIIRKTKSWENTDAWGILNKYKGKIIIFAGGKDAIIPPEIIQKIYDNSVNAKYREIISFPDVPHKIISEYLNMDNEKLKMVLEKIIKELK